MAKLFYTLEEACAMLDKSEDDVRAMAQSGQLEEMRDGDQIMFKRQQIDLLVGDSEGVSADLDLDLSGEGSSLGIDLSGESDGVGGEPTSDSASAGGSGYGLSDSGAGLGLGGSASGLDLGGSGSGFGFDLGDSGSAAGLDLGDSSSSGGSGIHAAFTGGEDDDSAETRVADAVDEELSLESVGSGSGLLDLTRESDDTSLGAELLDEVWEDDSEGEFDGSESGLFDSSDAQKVPAAADAPMGLPVQMVSAYDGKWSGTGIGLLLGSLFALVAVCLMLITSIMGVPPKLATMVASDLVIWGGGFIAFAVLAGLIGMFIGKASE